jgi:hypothetical protein
MSDTRRLQQNFVARFLESKSCHQTRPFKEIIERVIGCGWVITHHAEQTVGVKKCSALEQFL